MTEGLAVEVREPHELAAKGVGRGDAAWSECSGRHHGNDGEEDDGGSDETHVWRLPEQCERVDPETVLTFSAYRRGSCGRFWWSMRELAAQTSGARARSAWILTKR